ncbi:integral membrane protein [Neofusicoccum parvum]|uniref:Putative integral membrane protein n=1 Tax=Botryosphaeria parva (strain UCR-NP2) TaxID=1287680 RepID=R1E7S3_BOTPV|nr:putative integral membrane protein [Neofusicoccum parvum UCRNP2]GME52399.1 integral membrane protein [Neofusicoccum parvum]
MFVVVAYTLGIMFSLIFPCKPIASNWDITISGECINKTGIYIATAIINIATDLALLILPIPILARLQIPGLEKAALIAMFGVGSMTCVTSVVRLVLLLPMLTDLDQTWAVSIPCVWILVEANLVVICGCLPIIRKFARHVAPRLFSDPASSGGGGASDCANAKPAFDFQTIGSKRSRPLAGGSGGRKGRKGRTDYSNIELESRWTAAGGSDDSVPGAREEEDGRRGSSSGGGPPRTAWSDGGSETCIVETKTTVVEYGDATESIRRGFARPRGV